MFADAGALAAAAAGFWGDGRDERFCVLTGGEPMLQVADALVAALHDHGFVIAIESNGTLPAHPGIDWVCVSPKAESARELLLAIGDQAVAQLAHVVDRDITERAARGEDSLGADLARGLAEAVLRGALG